MISSTSFLDSVYTKIPARQRQWHIDNNVYSLVMCKHCQSVTVGWSVKNKRYSTYCGSKCANSTDEVKDKRAQTCVVRYNSTTNLSTAENKQRAKDTCVAKYGVDNFSKTEQFGTKFKQTVMDRYGVDNPSKLQSVKDKITDSHLSKYNRKRASQVHIPIDIIALKDDRNEMNRLYNELKMPISEIAELLGVNHSQLCVHFKDNLGIDISRHAVSMGERQIYDFVLTLDPTVVQSDRTVIKPKELDIYSKAHNVAIEVNGLAWHSELRGKGKNYHKDKTVLCGQRGLRLIHIFDLEWSTKQDIVKSRLRSVFGKNTVVWARKCKIVKMESSDGAEFFARTHIQGPCVAKVTYGLEYDGKVVCAMSFGTPRFDKSQSWELLRFSNELNTNVVGGAGRLLKHFIKGHLPTSIISYCDLRWNTGNLYEQLGFTLVRTTEPNYWYTFKHATLEHRMNYQKHKLKDKLPHYDETLTTWDNLVANGYDRVWDCGNSVFVMTLD